MAHGLLCSKAFSLLIVLLAAQAAALAGDCPRKYIQVVGIVGRLNNNIYTFKNALWLALQTNRTAVICDSDPHVAPIDQIFDLDELSESTGLCIVDKKSPLLGVNGITSEELPKLPSYAEGLLEHILAKQNVDVLKISATDVFYSYLYGPAEVSTAQCKASVAPLCQYREFRGSESDKKFDSMFYENIDFKPTFHQLAESFGSQHLSDQYVAVHLRYFEGECRIPQLHNYIIDNTCISALDSCHINTGLVDEIMRLSGHDPLLYSAESRNLFMATDRQEKSVDAAFTNRGFVGYTLTGDASAVQLNIKGLDVIMDMVMLLHAELFIGTEHSTLAKFIGGMRRMRGKRSILQWPAATHS